MWVVFIIVCLVAVPSLSQNHCQRKCGDVSIPYPFGLDAKCFRDETFRLSCNESFSPPQLYLDDMRVVDISIYRGQLTVLLPVAFQCYASDGAILSESKPTQLKFKAGYTLSQDNVFVAIGCDTQASIMYNLHESDICSSSSKFSKKSYGTYDDCNGNGCCEIELPHPLYSANVTLQRGGGGKSSTCWSQNMCSYGFFVRSNGFFVWLNGFWNEYSAHVGATILSINDTEYSLDNSTFTPVILDWSIKSDYTCSDIQQPGFVNRSCGGNNTYCHDRYYIQGHADIYHGYFCSCQDGYEGYPYDPHKGCQDINECDTNPCGSGVCSNTEGSYACECPPHTFHYYGGIKECIEDPPHSLNPNPILALHLIPVVLGIVFGVVFLVLGTSWMCWTLHKRKLDKHKKKFFQQNGGLLLQQKILSQNISVETTKVFTSKELKEATNNYHESQILGRGGNGIVYKGKLSDGRIVAVKKSKRLDTQQTEEFINEILILSQINHRNVVKLLGCCLETENPLLVYEFINNGTLFHHINDVECKSSLSWSNRLRIAAETAGALAYLHSSASQPVFHRDVKSANILLDERCIVKVADFGASKLISLDQTHLSTLVQGTMGYLDPEYMHTSMLTAKSDVYSFGVVLVELLTGRKAVCLDKPEKERNLATFFVSSLMENNLFEALEERVASEGQSDQLTEVSNLASKCLRLHGQERPTMREVAMTLEAIRMSEIQSLFEKNDEDNAYLQREFEGYQYNDSRYDDVGIELTNSMNNGR